MTPKEQFLLDHNRLCSIDLRVNMDLLSRFETEKPLLCKNSNWSMEKVRRPFIMWLTAFNRKEIKTINKGI